jgi:hypothetical protein
MLPIESNCCLKIVSSEQNREVRRKQLEDSAEQIPLRASPLEYDESYVTLQSMVSRSSYDGTIVFMVQVDW